MHRRSGWRRLLFRGVVLAALLPLSILLAVRLAQLVADPIIGLYGFTVFASLCLVMYLAFAEYADPAEVRPGRGTPSVSCMVAVQRDRPDRVLRAVDPRIRLRAA